MKSKQNFSKKNEKRSSYNEFDERKGLKPVKNKSGKSNKKISIYDDLDDDFDENELDDINFDNIDLDMEDELGEEDDDY